MKVAFCLYGLAGGINDKFGGLPVDFKIGFEHYKKHILDKNDCDVFIHTWSVGFEKGIKESYKPKKSLFERQIMFHKPNLLLKLANKDPLRIHSIRSRWYSTKKVIGLKKEFEEKNGFRYDCVFLTRFDVAFFTDVYFNQFDMGKFYAAHANNYYTQDGKKILNKEFNQTKKTMDVSNLVRKPSGYPYEKKGGIADYWFFSNSEAMDKFSALYDNLGKYFLEVRLAHPIAALHNMKVFNNHLLAVRHLREINMLDNLDFAFNRFDDFELVRRQFFGIEK